MKRKGLKIAACLLLIFLLIFLFKIFYPRSYDVPQLHTRADEQYWNLSTGSRIGYVLIKAKNSSKTCPIIYLHGGPGGHINDSIIHDLLPLADSGYNVYLYDQIGSGQSARLNNIKDYTVDRNLKDLEEIIQKTGAQKVILIGQSWGAILATLFASDYADKIDKLILTSPGPIYPVNNNLANCKLPDSIDLQNPVYTNAQGNKLANNIRTKTMAFFATALGKKIATDAEADAFERI
jgi:proline iminopeptidase